MGDFGGGAYGDSVRAVVAEMVRLNAHRKRLLEWYQSWPWYRRLWFRGKMMLDTKVG